MKIFFIFFAFLIPCSTVDASNIMFFEGDAFFSVSINKYVLKELQKKKPTFTYTSSFYASMSCGYLGYMNLQTPNMPKTMKTNVNKVVNYLRRVYLRRQRKSGATMPNIKSFLYNRGYNWKRYPISLRYNESWIRGLLPFLPADNDHFSRPTNLVYMARTKRELKKSNEISNKLKAMDVKYQRTVKPLNISSYPTVPGPKLLRRGGKITLKYRSLSVTKPMVSKAPLQWLILEDEEVSNYIWPKKGVTLYQVTEKIKVFRWNRGKWNRIKKKL